jgi:hypothetical protein
MSPRSFAGEYREAICDSDLSPSARLVGFALSCHVSAKHGAEVWPAKTHLAEDTGLSVRTVDLAINELERASYLTAKRSLGRTSNRYTLTPNPVTVARLESRQPRKSGRPTPQITTSNPAAAAHESIECFESGAPSAAAGLWGAAACALIEDDCVRCGERKPIHPQTLICVVCDCRRHADKIIDGVRRDLDDTHALLAAKEANQ